MSKFEYWYFDEAAEIDEYAWNTILAVLDPPETDDSPEPEPFPETPSTDAPSTDIGWEWTEGTGSEWDTY